MNHPNSPGFESFQKQHLPKPPEQQELNELYGETYQQIATQVGEAAATAYLQEKLESRQLNVDFGPTSPLSEAHNLLYMRPVTYEPNLSGQRQPELHVPPNAAYVIPLDKYRTAPTENTRYLQGPEKGGNTLSTPRSIHRRRLGRWTVGFGGGRKAA